jgi:hypothetical protein
MPPHLTRVRCRQRPSMTGLPCITWLVVVGNVEILYQGSTEWLRLTSMSRAQYPAIQGYVLAFPRDAYLVGPVQIRFQAVSVMPPRNQPTLAQF